MKMSGDKMYEVACKKVVKVAEDICRILKCIDNKVELKRMAQKGQRNFLRRDWTPSTLRVAYDKMAHASNPYGDGLVCKEIADVVCEEM